MNWERRFAAMPADWGRRDEDVMGTSFGAEGDLVAEVVPTAKGIDGNSVAEQVIAGAILLAIGGAAFGFARGVVLLGAGIAAGAFGAKRGWL